MLKMFWQDFGNVSGSLSRMRRNCACKYQTEQNLFIPHSPQESVSQRMFKLSNVAYGKGSHKYITAQECQGSAFLLAKVGPAFF